MAFRVVDDALRTTDRTPGRWADEVKALTEGQTIFIAGLESDRAAGLYTTIARRNMKLHTRKFVDPETKESGIVLWAEAVEPQSSDANEPKD